MAPAHWAARARIRQPLALQAGCLADLLLCIAKSGAVCDCEEWCSHTLNASTAGMPACRPFAQKIRPQAAAHHVGGGQGLGLEHVVADAQAVAGALVGEALQGWHAAPQRGDAPVPAIRLQHLAGQIEHRQHRDTAQRRLQSPGWAMRCTAWHAPQPAVAGCGQQPLGSARTSPGDCDARYENARGQAASPGSMCRAAHLGRGADWLHGALKALGQRVLLQRSAVQLAQARVELAAPLVRACMAAANMRSLS